MIRARHIIAVSLSVFITFFGLSVMALEKATNQVLFKNVNVFDGKADMLALGMRVLF
jgi:hypothetical protein